MDKQTQSFLELSAMDDLVQLVADKRAAWLWSADGARILWANAAGASFFSAHKVSDLAGLSALERSPARPHIARIAESGLTNKFSIDRLRFYKGLRVMLLTCQCMRIELENGDAAALIVCGDKGLASTRDPESAFAHMLAGPDTTVFLTAGGDVGERVGELAGAPEDPDLPEDQKALFGPLELDGRYHEGVVLRISAGHKLVVLDNIPLPEDMVEEPDGTTGDAASLASEQAFPAAIPDGSPDQEAEAIVEPSSETDAPEPAEAPILDLTPDEAEPVTDAAVPAEELADELPAPDVAASGENDYPAKDVSGEGETAAVSDEDDESRNEDVPVGAQQDENPEPEAAVTADDQAGERAEPAEAAAETGGAFVFQPRRRPVRFAWKMDIDQRFTFLSDEIADVLGPDATDIVGLTWEEVSEKFELDPRGNIARALDRRDTWSGKTVNWPVTGAPLRVPVDMAALPAFDRDRKFEGYRGFGVCRTADAIEVKESLLSPALAAFDQTFASPTENEAAEEDQTDESVEDTALLDEPLAENEPDADGEPTAHLDAETGALEEPAGAESPAEETAEDTDLPEETGALDHAEAEEEPAAQETAGEATDTVDDLKPAQPDTFSGKTFLGASAAALVGSLAKFTGKSAPKTPEDPTELPDDALEREQPGGTLHEDEDTVNIAAALDEKLKDLEAGTESIGAPSSAEAEEAPADIAGHEDQDPASDEDGTDSGDELTDLPPEPEEEEPEEIAAVVEDTAEKETARPAEEEPTGISGPAALEPAEIESAVKSLAKSYNATQAKARDLFEQELSEANETIPSAPDQDTADVETEDAEDASVPAATAEDESGEEPFEPVPALEDTHFDIVEEDGRKIEDAAAGLDEDDTSAEEREFFEETAAFEAEDKEADVSEEPPAASASGPEKPTGKVIPLATAKPRVVPVDTSGLSRPERQAFRKIAEALGARLEGDLEDFDEPDAREKEAEVLPPEEPEAGPIDPSLLDRLPIGIAIVHDRDVLYANKVLLGMLGYKSISALTEAGGLEALFIDDTDELADAVGMDGEVDEAMKLRLADGGVLNVDAHMHSVPWNGSRGLMISITERQGKPPSTATAPASPNFFAEVRSELDSARNQIAEMDTILETATDGVLVLDQHGTILKVNGSAEALFSANRSDMIGAPFTEYLAPESHRAAADYLDGLTRNGVASILNDGREVLGKVPTGGLIPLFMTIGRITSGKDDAKYCAVLRDITQWKTAEEELTQAKRQAENASSQKSDFLAKISHEIRTPLNAIIGFSEVMMEERFGPIGNDRYKDYLKDIRTSGSHIMSLINDLLDLSKIEAGKLDLKFSAVSTSDVINECVALMQPQANRERVIIRASLPDSVPDVVADPRSLRQIVLNLLSNAIKYNKSGGQVILSTALESNGEVALRVRDTGTGMTAKQLAAALEPFRQLHTASRGGGTGLGLPLTKALVEANRASFHIDSTPDQGTLVEIIFPTQRVLSE